MSDSHVPLPVNVTLTSQLFQLSPIASSSNNSSGWVPSCAFSDCVSNATWSTGLINSTLDFTFWGWDAALDGNVQGDMDVKLTFDGQEMLWDPSNGTLFSFKAPITAIDKPYRISLKVLNASADALLTVNQARVNGSTFLGFKGLTEKWTLHSNNDAFSYTGFVQQTSAPGSVSPTTHVSSSAGDKAFLKFNGSTALIYGPCGPSSGLMSVTINGSRTTVNTSKPIQADDCLLFQSHFLAIVSLHQLEIENMDGGELHLNRIDFMRLVYYGKNDNAGKHAGIAVGVISGVFILAVAFLFMFSMRSPERREKMKALLAPLYS